MSDLRVSLLQADLFWEQPEKNRAYFEKEIASLPATDLVVLPEMFTTGFTMDASGNAETAEGPSLKWMQSMALNHQLAITGSLIIEEEGRYYNRLYFVKPDGSYESYDKRHTFTLAGEDKVYTAGNRKLIIDYKGWKICPLICYDLRFPVWIRNVEDYDLVLFVANWPERRVAAWDALLKARAIENMAYCIGVNRVGNDGNGHPYVGHSAVYDVLGERISTDAWEQPFNETLHLSKEHLQKLRAQLQFLADRDAFSLK